MSAPILDASVIIRLITKDDPAKLRASRNLLQSVELGEQELVLPEFAVGEAVYVLSSPRLYAFPRINVANALTAICRLPGIQMHNKRVMIDALALYGHTRIDFADCYIVATIRHSDATGVYSYDEDFDRFADIQRMEP